MRWWSKCWIQWPQRFHPSCNSSTICYSLSHTIASSFQLNTSQVSTVKSLMLFLVSIGRNFDSWLQVFSQPQHQSLPSFCWNWSVFSRTAVSHFPHAWPSPIHWQDLCNRSKEVLQILSSARQASSLWVALSHWWIDSVSVCNFSGEIHTPFDYQGLYVWCLCASCWAGVTRSSTELSALATGHLWD